VRPVILVAAVVVAGLLIEALRQRAASRRRLFEHASPDEGAVLEPAPGIEDTRLRTWLTRAGTRDGRAPERFLVQQGVVLVVAVAAAWATAASGLEARLTVWAEEIPGGIGTLGVPVLSLAPWIVFALVASVPLLRVRARRRRRVREIERDLPVSLELLATLGQAGFSFDAALDRVLRVQDPDEALSRELRTFRQDVMAGIPRVRALRAFAWRTDLTSTSVLVAALVQAEQVGSSLAETLRGQAADLWVRRRESALAQAQSLPARLAFPVVLCFLPALFVITLGPILTEFIELAENVLSQSS